MSGVAGDVGWVFATSNKFVFFFRGGQPLLMFGRRGATNLGSAMNPGAGISHLGETHQHATVRIKNRKSSLTRKVPGLGIIICGWCSSGIRYLALKTAVRVRIRVQTRKILSKETYLEVLNRIKHAFKLNVE